MGQIDDLEESPGEGEPQGHQGEQAAIEGS